MLHVFVELVFLLPLAGALSDHLYGDKAVREDVSRLVHLTWKSTTYLLQYLVSFLEDWLAGEVTTHLHPRLYCHLYVCCRFYFYFFPIIPFKNLLYPVACRHECLLSAWIVSVFQLSTKFIRHFLDLHMLTVSNCQFSWLHTIAALVFLQKLAHSAWHCLPDQILRDRLFAVLRYVTDSLCWFELVDLIVNRFSEVDWPFFCP